MNLMYGLVNSNTMVVSRYPEQKCPDKETFKYPL
jgi:hypothetical protein